MSIGSLFNWGQTASANNSLQWRHNERDGVSNNESHDCLLNRLFGRRSKETSEIRVTGLCEGNSPVTGEFPALRACNAENVSSWWNNKNHRLSTQRAARPPKARATPYTVGQRKKVTAVTFFRCPTVHRKVFCVIFAAICHQFTPIVTVTWLERHGVSITGNSAVCSTCCLGVHQGRKHESYALLAICDENPPVSGGLPSQSLVIR